MLVSQNMHTPLYTILPSTNVEWYVDHQRCYLGRGVGKPPQASDEFAEWCDLLEPIRRWIWASSGL